MLLLWSARNDKITSLHYNKVDCKLTLSTLTWTCTLSILSPMYILLCGDEENLFFNQELLSSDHSPYSPVLNGWFQGDILGRNHSCRCYSLLQIKGLNTKSSKLWRAIFEILLFLEMSFTNSLPSAVKGFPHFLPGQPFPAQPLSPVFFGFSVIPSSSLSSSTSSFIGTLYPFHLRPALSNHWRYD